MFDDCELSYNAPRNSKDNYTQTWHNGKLYATHRLVYAESRGLHINELDGLVVMHLCDNQQCVNPPHLQVATQQDNVKDMWAKGRQGVEGMLGSKHPMAKITEDDVRWIRTEGRRMTGKDLAKKFGVSVATISLIRSGRTWKHVV